MTRYRLAGSLFLLLALSAVQAGAGRAKYATPQEAFDAAKKAGEKSDWKGFCGTLTEGARDSLSAYLLELAFVIQALSGEAKQAKDEIKPVTDVLVKYRLTPDSEAMKKALAKFGDKEKADPQGLRKVLTKLLQEQVKDRCAFVADSLAGLRALEKLEAKGGKASKGFPFLGEIRLEDVKVKGDQARGTLVSKQSGMERRLPLAFRRVEGSWRIELPFLTEMGRK
jgi:hypothetical protein